MAKKPAVFLDRDGTLIEDEGYIRHASQVRFYPDTLEALSLLQEHFLLFIITNQSGIAKGITTESEVSVVNSHILNILKNNGIIITDLFCCPHRTEDNCECKKPKTLFFEQACRLYDIDPERSYIIGDHPSDVQFGVNAGINPVYLLTGHGRQHLGEVSSETKICNGILDATEFIISTGFGID